MLVLLDVLRVDDHAALSDNSISCARETYIHFAHHRQTSASQRKKHTVYYIERKWQRRNHGRSEHPTPSAVIMNLSPLSVFFLESRYLSHLSLSRSYRRLWSHDVLMSCKLVIPLLCIPWIIKHYMWSAWFLHFIYAHICRKWSISIKVRPESFIKSTLLD